MVQKYGRSRKIDWFDGVNLILLLFLAFLVFYPFYNALLVSFVSAQEYAVRPAMLFPRKLIVDNYLQIFHNSLLLSGYVNTLIIVFAGVLYNMLLTVSMAYAFSRREFPGKRVFFSITMFTMFFGGGLIPFYLLIKDLGLMGSLWSVILYYGVNTFYMLIFKTGFEQVPDSLEEASKMDGANDLTIFFRIMLPLQRPLIATFTLFFAVDRWNDWYYPMLFLNEGNTFPLQVVLRSIVFEATSSRARAFSSVSPRWFSGGIKMASVVVTMLPIMLAYPFLQKHFIKGVLLGAIKM